MYVSFECGIKMGLIVDWDLEAGYEYLLNEYEFIDPERTVALGASYGGYMVFPLDLYSLLLNMLRTDKLDPRTPSGKKIQSPRLVHLKHPHTKFLYWHHLSYIVTMEYSPP